MKIHVLPGDALVENFENANIEADETIVCRECLIEGAVESVDLDGFWKVRAEFIRSAYGAPENSYRKMVVGEFEKLRKFKLRDAVYLWFEYDLFCQANMWFCLSLLRKTEATIYRVAPVAGNADEIWKGFGELNAEDLRKCLERKIKFGREDLRLGANLWKAYQNKDFDKMEMLGETKSECFPKLEEVCRAEIEKQTRPQIALRKIIAEGEIDFPKVFKTFSEREAIYGYGDAQIKNIYDRIEK